MDLSEFKRAKELRQCQYKAENQELNEKVKNFNSESKCVSSALTGDSNDDLDDGSNDENDGH